VKKNRPTKVPNRPRGWIFGAKWSGEICEARACKITVGVAPDDWWCKDLVGQERRAIEVNVQGQTVYVDNQDGRALDVFLRCLAPMPKFRWIPAFLVMDDPDAELFYKAVPA
jgi:hypothetical protein